MSWGVFPRKPDEVIGGHENPYMLRWFVIPKNRWCNIYLHKFLRDDDDRALHDHPWSSCSIILRGGYREHLPGGVVKERKPFRPVFRSAEQPHRVELYKRGSHVNWLLYGDDGTRWEREAWSLFITGPWRRHWGFHCPKGWMHWRDFCDPTDPGKVGPGCGD